MNRRSFITNILALGAAPSIVRADSLMRLVPRETTLMRLVPRETTLILYPWQKELLCIFYSDDMIITAPTREYYARGFERRTT